MPEGDDSESRLTSHHLSYPDGSRYAATAHPTTKMIDDNKDKSRASLHPRPEGRGFTDFSGKINEEAIKQAIGGYLATEMTRYAIPSDIEWERNALAKKLRAGDFKLNNTQEIVNAALQKRIAEQLESSSVVHQLNVISMTDKPKIRSIINAKATFGFPKGGIIGSAKEAEGKALKADVDLLSLHIEASIGRMALKGEPLLGHFDGSYILNFWAPYDGSDARHDVIIRPDLRSIAVNVYRASSLLDIEIDIDGEIVGRGLSDEINQGRNYGGLYFSTEPGQRDANLFEVTDLVARAIVMAKNNMVPGHEPVESVDQDDGFRLG